MASVLQSIGVQIEDKEMAMAVLNGLPPGFDTIITALDAIGADDPSHTFDKVRSRLVQEERLSDLRATSKHSVSESALLNRHPGGNTQPNKKKCTHCGKTNHTEPYCWKQYGHPTRNERGKHQTQELSRYRPAGMAAAANISNEDPIKENTDFVCLMKNGRANSPHEQENSAWYIDSAATSHMTFTWSLFTTYKFCASICSANRRHLHCYRCWQRQRAS